MESIAAIGLASSILTFIDFSTKLVGAAKEIHDSASGNTSSDESLQKVTRYLKKLSEELATHEVKANDSASRKLQDLNSDCQDVADDLLDLLNNIQAKDPSSKRQSVKAAFKKYRKSKDVDELKDRLLMLSAALDRHVQVVYQSEFKKQAESTRAFNDHTTSNLSILQSKLDSIASVLKATSSNTDTLKNLMELLNLSQDSVLQARYQRILNALHYSGINQRYEAIEPAHERTFEWILEEDTEPSLQASSIPSPSDSTSTADLNEVNADDSISKGYLSEPMRKGKAAFDDWLLRDRPIFHILGKPGTGKSTLMKFLSSHPKTTDKLCHWANGRKLIVSHFFFWKPGDRLQKSIEGLMRSLLYSVLKQKPDLIPLVLETQWRATLSSLSLPAGLVLEGSEVESAFEILLSLSQIARDHCFAFFVDGLDEFEPQSIKQTHYSLAVKLRRWSEAQKDTLKLCVSSREYPELEKGFAGHVGMRLQELTSQDIKLFITDFIAASKPIQKLRLDSKQLRDLKQRLSEGSDGVFLWTSLVLRNMEQGLINGDDIIDTSTTLLSLPSELEDMILEIFRMIDQQHLQYCVSLIHIVTVLDQTRGALWYSENLYPLWFLESTLFGPTRGHLKVLTDPPADPAERLKSLSSALSDFAKRIKWRCRGLLEIKSGAWYDDTERHRAMNLEVAWPQLADQLEKTKICPALKYSVGLCHRSVADALESKPFKDMNASAPSNADVFHHLCESFQTYFEAAVLGRIPIFFPKNVSLDNIEKCLRYQLSIFLHAKWPLSGETLRIESMCSSLAKMQEICDKNRGQLVSILPKEEGRDGRFDVEFCAVESSFYEYFEHRYRHDFYALRTRSLHLLELASISKLFAHDSKSNHERMFRTITTLLDHGLDVASPSKEERHVCNTLVTFLIWHITRHGSALSAVESLRDVVQALLLKGATLSCWAVMLNVRKPIFRERPFWYLDAVHEEVEKPFFSVADDVRARYGVPVFFGNISGLDAKVRWGAIPAPQGATDFPLSDGQKCFLSELLDRSGLSLIPEAREKLLATETRLRSILGDYEVRETCADEDHVINPGQFHVRICTLENLQNIPEDIRHRTGGSFVWSFKEGTITWSPDD